MYKQYINGELVQGKGVQVDVLDPADNSVITKLDTASVEQCQEALEAAKAAFKGWAATPIGVRIEWLLKLGDAIQAERETIAELLSAESGKPYDTAMEDLGMFDRYLKYFAEEGKRVDGTTVYTPGKSYGELYHAVEHRPLGVVVGHIAWNYPIGMLVLKVAPAMVAGDPLIVKPASDTPLATLYVGEICKRIGLPKGVINIVCG
ncbi:MAG: aldehyde dehydrogenase family protein, partial [Bacillota bacterium]